MSDKKIKVRIAVAVSEDGSWVAVGDGATSDKQKMDFLKSAVPSSVEGFYFVEATLPSKVVKGSVEAVETTDA